MEVLLNNFNLNDYFEDYLSHLKSENDSKYLLLRRTFETFAPLRFCTMKHLSIAVGRQVADKIATLSRNEKIAL